MTARVFVVTGGARGVGLATIRHLIRSGAAVTACDSGIDREGGTPDPSVIASAMAEFPAERVLTRCDDVTSPTAAADLVGTTLERFGRIDGLFHAAGFRTDMTLMRAHADRLVQHLAVSIQAAHALTRELVPILEKNDSGGAVLIAAGTEAFFGAQRKSIEAASAGAMVGWVRSAAVELRKHGVRINALVPTARTRLTEDTALFQGIATESMSVEYVAPVAAFLLSEAAANITGEAVGVAGARAYVIRARESIGIVAENGPLDETEIANRWREIVRG